MLSTLSLSVACGSSGPWVAVLRFCPGNGRPSDIFFLFPSICPMKCAHRLPEPPPVPVFSLVGPRDLFPERMFCFSVSFFSLSLDGLGPPLAFHRLSPCQRRVVQVCPLTPVFPLLRVIVAFPETTKMPSQRNPMNF